MDIDDKIDVLIKQCLYLNNNFNITKAKKVHKEFIKLQNVVNKKIITYNSITTISNFNSINYITHLKNIDIKLNNINSFICITPEDYINYIDNILNLFKKYN